MKVYVLAMHYLKVIPAKTSHTGSIIITAELVSVSVTAGEYLDKVTENAAMKVYVLAMYYLKGNPSQNLAYMINYHYS